MSVKVFLQCDAHTHTHTQLGVTTSVASLIFCSGLCRFSRQFPSARPDVLAHTPSNLSQEGGGSPASLPPPLHPRQGCLYLTFPLTHSLTHSPCLSHSLCFPTVVTLMAVMGSACQSGCPLPPTHPPPPQQAAVCNYRAAPGLNGLTGGVTAVC